MFELNEKYEVYRNILKCDYLRYSPSDISTMNTANSQIIMNKPTEDSFNSFSNSYLDLNFEVVKKADNNRYSNDYDTRLVFLGPIALFGSLKLTESIGKHLEDNNRAQIVYLNYELITSAKDTDNLISRF